MRKPSPDAATRHTTLARVAGERHERRAITRAAELFRVMTSGTLENLPS